MTELHQLLGRLLVLAAIGLIAVAAWSVVAGRRSGGEVDHRFAVDRAILLAVALAAVNGAAGLALVGTGSAPGDPLHILYGPAALITAPLGWWLGGRRRGGGAATRLHRDAWIVGAGVVLAGLAVRLMMTG